MWAFVWLLVVPVDGGYAYIGAVSGMKEDESVTYI